MYHNSRSTVAAVRTVAKSTHPTGRIDVRQFAEEVQFVARQLFFSTPKKSERDAQFLQDVMRGETRFPFRSFERLAGLAKTSERVEHREAFAELVRKYSLPEGICCDLIAASNREQQANGPFDVAVRAFEQAPSLSTKAAAIDAGRAQFARTRELLDAIEATPVYA